jgi:cytoskeletal protein RodZ
MPTLGQQLKNLREEKGVTLRDIANSTHIGLNFLQAIENDTYDVLPGGVFNRAFVRKFAKIVGLDEEQAVKLYEEQLEEQGGEPQRNYQYGIEDFDAKPSSGNGLLLSFVALLILGALAYAAYQYFAPSVAGPVPGDSSNPVAATPTPTPDTATSGSPAASPEASPSPAQAPPGAMRVMLTATTEDCWISIKPDSEKAEQFTMAPGDVREFNVNEKLVMVIGKVTALRITINGRIVNYGKLLPDLKGVVAENVIITKENYQEYLD